ncbi:MAG: hypothetical protein K2X86_09015 [Cytophagaceae bacterium]|nr:hypothetical protein [Cytophagaceae bacterium]
MFKAEIMRTLSYFTIFLILTGFASSCILQAPKYSPVENVLKLQLGMSQDEVSALLKIPPHDLKSKDTSGYVLIYKYRLTERNTIPLFMGPNNGVKARGKWVDLFVTFSPEGKVTAINSCSECGDTEIRERRIDTKVFVTLTLPYVLVFLKLD